MCDSLSLKWQRGGGGGVCMRECTGMGGMKVYVIAKLSVIKMWWWWWGRGGGRYTYERMYRGGWNESVCDS